MTVQKTKAKGKPKNARGAAKKPVKQRRPKLLTRRDLIKPVDTNETHVDVQRALTGAKGTADIKGKLNLTRDSIVVAERVFQWRLPDTDVAEREAHILDMANWIADGGKPLDAILVLSVGDKFYIMDGHHRLAAYDTAKWSKAIPARVFEGTLPEARREALRLNSKNKLPMTNGAKQEAAWRLVKQQDLSKSQIHEWTAVSTTNIANMRAKLGELKDRGRTAEELETLTWVQARGTWEPEDREFDVDDWKERKAKKIVDALQNANIGFMLREQPEITAMALERLDENLVAALMGEWLYRPENEDFIVGLIEARLDEGDVETWKSQQGPKQF
jgi:hypothetical protein